MNRLSLVAWIYSPLGSGSKTLATTWPRIIQTTASQSGQHRSLIVLIHGSTVYSDQLLGTRTCVGTRVWPTHLPSTPRTLPDPSIRGTPRLVYCWHHGYLYRGQSNHRKQGVCFDFYYSLFIGPTKETLYPGPLFLCELALQTFMPRLVSWVSIIFLSYSFSMLCLIFSETEGICLLLVFLFGAV